MSWAEERAKQIKENERLHAFDRAWQIHSSKTIEAKAPSLWKELASSIEQKVGEFNQVFPNEPQHRLELETTVPNGLIVRKPYFPALCLTARLELAEHTIRFTIKSTPSYDSGTRETSGILRIRLLDGGELYILNGEKLLTIEEASRLLLDSVTCP